MSVTFNATVSNGLVITPDNSGQIQFQLNGVNVPSPSVAPAFSAYQSFGTNQSLSGGTSTKIILNTKLFDTNNNFDAVTTYRFTPTVAGYYQFSFGARSDSSSVANFQATLTKNGVTQIISGNFTSTTTAGWQSVGSGLVYLNGSTDYVELYAYSGNAITLTSEQNYVFLTGFLARTA